MIKTACHSIFLKVIHSTNAYLKLIFFILPSCSRLLKPFCSVVQGSKPFLFLLKSPQSQTGINCLKLFSSACILPSSSFHSICALFGHRCIRRRSIEQISSGRGNSFTKWGNMTKWCLVAATSRRKPLSTKSFSDHHQSRCVRHVLWTNERQHASTSVLPLFYDSSQ